MCVCGIQYVHVYDAMHGFTMNKTFEIGGDIKKDVLATMQFLSIAYIKKDILQNMYMCTV